jgi:nucleoside 2-deoxyribosyltransferase
MMVLGPMADELAAVVVAEGFTVVRWPVRDDEKDEDGSEQYAAALTQLENIDFLLCDVARYEPTVVWAMGYAAARGKTTLAFAKRIVLPVVLDRSAYTVEDFDAVRSVCKALDPKRKPYVPGTMKSWDDEAEREP